MARVIIFGTFDLLHKGHENFFEQAKKYGDELVVVVARDVNVRKVKRRAPVFGENDRLAQVRAHPLVDQAVLGHEHDDRYQIVRELKPDMICIGYDQRVPREFEQGLLDRGITAKIVRLKAYFPEKYKTTKLRKKLRKQ